VLPSNSAAMTLSRLCLFAISAANVTTQSRLRAVSCSAPEPIETIEDQVEAKLELVGVIVMGMKDVLERQLGKVGKFLGKIRPANLLLPLNDILWRLERQVRLVQRESV
jgi:hypothetical protein